MRDTAMDVRKKLFADGYRRRPHSGGPRARMLGGQAMAWAQRFSSETIRPALLAKAFFVADVVMIAGAAKLAMPLVPEFDVDQGLKLTMTWLGALMCVVLVRLLGGYRFRSMRTLWRSMAIGVVSLLAALYALRAIFNLNGASGPYLDDMILLWGTQALVFMALLRIMADMRIRGLIRTGRLEHRIVLVGGGRALERIIAEIDSERGHGRRLVGFFDERKSRRSPAIVSGHHKLGDVDDLVEFTRLARIDTVVIAIPRASEHRIRELLNRLFVLPVDIRVLEGADIPTHSRAVRSRISKLKLVEIYKRPLVDGQAMQKRAFDIVFSIFALIVFAPLLAVIALWIKIDSPGPVFFKQRRHGFNNKPIAVYKFRSMYADKCDPTAVKQVRKGDSRVTKVGRFIRRASIDELPQFWNVLRGELSLVGPRPHAISARTGDIIYEDIAQAYSARHKVKPGVTGWAQINGYRGEMNSSEKIAKRVEYDLFYIEHWSLWFDFKIMMLTPWSLVTTKSAY